MKARLPFLIGIGLFLICSTAIYWQRNVDHDSSFLFSEPRYQGESLSYWLQNLYTYNQTRRINYASQDAILHIGTNGLPLLLDWISKPDRKFFVPGEIDYQRHAVDAFEILGPIAKPAIPRLVEDAGQGSSYSMQALVFIGKDAVPPLAERLLATLADKHEPVMYPRSPRYQKGYYHIQVIILHGLTEMGTNAEAAIPAVTKALYANHAWGPYSSDEPFSTLAAIGGNHSEIVIPALIDALTNANAPAFNRGAVAHAMASYGTNYANAFLPVLIQAINDKRTVDWNRRTMARALAVLGQNHPDLVVSVLIEAFKKSGVEYQDGIADALAVLGSDARPALPLLLEATRSPNYNLREQAAIAIRKIAPERTNSLDALIKDLKNPERRQQTIYTLGRLGTNGFEAVPALLACLKRPDAQTRLDALQALNDMGLASDEFIAELGENLACTNSFILGEAEATLGRLAIHSKLAFVTLITQGIFSSISSEIRYQGKWLLINISRDDPKFMLECLNDSDAKVRSGALAVFSDLERIVPDSIPKLRDLAKNDPDADVRRRAADVLRLQSQ